MGAWSTADYLLRGRFCPFSTVEARLEDFRNHVHANAALLLVADERAVLRSLCSFAVNDRREELTAAVQASVVASAGLQDLIRGPGRPGGSSTWRFPRSAERIVGALGASIERESHRAWFAAPREWVPLRSAPLLRSARIACAVLAESPRDATLTEDGMVLDDDRASVEFAEMVNCTVQADVRRDAITSARLDMGVDLSGIALDATGFATAAQQIVRLAVEVSGGHVGALYLRGTNRGELELAAVSGESASAQVTVPQRLSKQDTTATLSLNRNRAVQYPSTPVGTPVHATFREAPHTGTSWAELATPVLGPAANLRLPPAGVLVVARRSNDTHDFRSFSSYDHAVLRNVAMRLTLLRSATDMEEVARTYTQLSRRGPTAPKRAAESAPRSGEDPVTVLPTDLQMALPQIELGLGQIARATDSHSATFRAVLPDPTNEQHGVRLVRIAAYPHERNEDRRAKLHQQEGGVNWRTVLSGRVNYIPRVAEDSDYLEARADTASELAIPVRVEERIVGVINLESTEEHAYASRADSASLLATHIGLAISDARLELSRDLEALAIEVVTRRHDFAGDAKRVAEFADKLSDDTARASLHEISDQIATRARQLRKMSMPATPGSGTLPTLLELVCKKISLTMESVEILSTVWPTHDGASAFGVYECLRHILANVKEHASTEPGSRPCAVLGELTWGGQSHDALHVTHRVTRDKWPGPLKAVNLYRVPLTNTLSQDAIPDPRNAVRPRFGAYLAGMQARRLGGDAWLATPAAETVRVSVVIPRTETAATQ